jgi:hypothetical protein
VDGYLLNEVKLDSFIKEVYIPMGTILVLAVMVTFLAAIFAAGYDDKPNANK